MVVNIHGFDVIIDDEDKEKVTSLRWHVICSRGGRVYFAHSFTEPKYHCRLHRFLVDCPEDMVVDHRDGNTLNNCKSNLRICTNAENLKNSKKRVTNHSGYKGVCYKERDGKYHASIIVNYKNIYLGRYATPVEAYSAYCEAAKKYHGEFARVI